MKNKQEKSNKKLFISVVVPAFNEERYLPLCLKSLTNQTYPKDRFQITVVDNNSTDKTSQIAKEFGAKVILEKRQGNTFALKRGMDEAKGDIIASTDADSKVAPDWLLIIGKEFLDPKVVAITGSVRLDGRSRLMALSMDILYIVSMHISAFIGKPNLSGFNFAVRKDAYLKVGGVNTLFTMSPDVDLGIRLNKIGKVKVVNDLRVTTSFRRWENEFLPTLFDYAKGHIYAAWFRKPPPVKQTVIR